MMDSWWQISVIIESWPFPHVQNSNANPEIMQMPETAGSFRDRRLGRNMAEGDIRGTCLRSPTISGGFQIHMLTGSDLDMAHPPAREGGV